MQYIILTNRGSYWSYSVAVITPDFESGNPSSSLGRTYNEVAQRQRTGPITRGVEARNFPSLYMLS